MKEQPTANVGAMPADIRERVVALRTKSKRGIGITLDEVRFLEDCWGKWPAEYTAIGREVFEATKPFGSR